MKKLLLLLVAFATVCGGALHAQDIAGIWQGTLNIPEANKSLRMELKIAKADDKLKGTLYSIDQNGQVIPVGTVTLQSGTVKFGLPGLLTYEGKLSADGNTITGNWNQGKQMPLEFKHVTEATAWPIPEAPVALKQMPADADPTFDVATIKPSKPDQPGKALTIRGRDFITINYTLNDLLAFAYDVQAKQITGGPEWMTTEKYDITAVPDMPGLPNVAQLKSLVRKLVTERFKLTYHHDKKEMSVYALTVGKSVSKIAKSASDPNGLPGLGFPRGLGKMFVMNATIGNFTNLMQSMVLDRPVVDQTGLTGKYDFTLNWAPDESQFGGLGAKIPPPTDGADALPGLFTAIQEQLGMKLDAVKAPVDVLVIDHVEKPSEN